MKTPKRFSRGITGLFLLFILALAGCQDPLSDYTITETGPSLPGPANLQAVKYTGGALLTWELVPDAAGYQVYRYNRATGEERALRGTTSSDHYYLDLVDFDNPLTPTTAEKPVTYTYKVVTISGGSGNRAAVALEELVFNGTSSVDVTFEAADIPARNADTSGWIKLDDPKVEDRSKGLKRVVLENTAPNLKYSAKFAVGGTVDGTDGSVFLYDDENDFDNGYFNPTKALDVPEFGGKSTVEVTASYARGEYYPGTAVKTAEITQESLPAPSGFYATSSGTDPEYVTFTWNNDSLATGYSIYKVKGYREGSLPDYTYYIQGDWTAVTLKDKDLSVSGLNSVWSAVEADSSEPGAYIYALVAEALVAETEAKKSIPAIYPLTLSGTDLSAPSGFLVTSTPAPYGLDDQYVLIQWNNDTHVETYTVYKAVYDQVTNKLGTWTEVTLSDKKLNTDLGGTSGVWRAVEKGLPKIDATYAYKLVATAGNRRAESSLQTLTTSSPANNGGFGAQSLINTGEPLKVQLTLGNLDPEVTYKLSRAEATWAEGETDFTIEKAVSVGAFNTPVEIKLSKYHTGDTYTFFDADYFTGANALKVRTSYIYKLVKEKSSTEISDPVYVALNQGAYSKASYLTITRNNNYDGVAFDIADAGTYWGDSPSIKIYRAPQDGEYGDAIKTIAATEFSSYGDDSFFEDDRTQLVNNAVYHYKFVVSLPDGTVLEERYFRYNDLDGDSIDDGRTQKAGGSTLYTPADTPVTAYFAEGSYPGYASTASVAHTDLNAKLRITVTGNYVINAPVTVTYTPYSSSVPGTSRTATSTVSENRTIEFTGDIDPNADWYVVTVSRTTDKDTNEDYTDFSGSPSVWRLTLADFSASAGVPYDSVALSVTPNRTTGENIPWAGTETVTVERKLSTATAYATVSTGLVLAPGTSPTAARTGLDNASAGLAIGSSYVYRINITGGYFGSKVYQQELSFPVSPNGSGSLGTLTITAPVTTGPIGLDFNSGFAYDRSIITVQYKLSTVLNWTDTGVNTLELTLDADGKASFARPAAGTYDIRYKYRNDAASAYTAGGIFTVTP